MTTEIPRSELETLIAEMQHFVDTHPTAYKHAGHAIERWAGKLKEINDGKRRTDDNVAVGIHSTAGDTGSDSAEATGILGPLEYTKLWKCTNCGRLFYSPTTGRPPYRCNCDGKGWCALDGATYGELEARLRSELETLIAEMRSIVEGFKLEGMNGVICTPPYRDFGGNDPCADWEAEPNRRWCPRCKARWARLFALPGKLEALLRRGAEQTRCSRCGGTGVDTYANPDSPTGFTERPCPACTPPPGLLKQIQDALVEAFYDPDPADPTPEVDYEKVDWVGVVKDARRRIDTLKAKISIAPPATPSCHACGGPITIGEPVELFHQTCYENRP